MALTTSLEPPIEPDLTAVVAPNEPNTLRDKYDPVDVDWKSWAPPGIDSTPQGENEIVPYIHGNFMFADMASAIRTATSATHFILIAGWSTRLDFDLEPGVAGATLGDLFKAASDAGVAIRALLYKHPAIGGFGSDFGNDVPVAQINALTHGLAIHDDRYIQPTSVFSLSADFGAHHQKIIVVSGQQGLVAFQGGNDMRSDRFSIHDVHTRVRGPAAVHLYQVFMERWNDQPLSKTTKPIPAPIPSIGVPDTNHFVQVGRTYPNGSNHPGIDTDASGAPKGYDFAPHGKREVEAMTLHAIDTAKRFIYLEDQYLVSEKIGNALAAKMPSLDFVLILICATNQVNNEPTGGAFWEHRRLFLDPIVAAATKANKQLPVFEYQGPWMHSKTWVFDDKYAIIGSANVNRRGYTHDSEQVCGIFDTNGRSKKGWFLAHELRMNLWAKHLGGPPISYRDPVSGLGLWRVSTRVSAYDRNFDLVPANKNLPNFKADNLMISSIWDSSFDPDGS